MVKRRPSAPSAQARKRSRRPRPEEDFENQDDVDDDIIEGQSAGHIEDQISANPEHPRSQPVANGAEVRDVDFEQEAPSDDSEDSGDEDDIKASIDLSQKRGFAHSGILESVQLHRFMCHECFRYDLGPNVNIVNGKNGSGKSAIVAALQIGLGARANATERATKLEDHIMHGQDSAVIVIKIRNRRPPEVENTISEPDLTYKHDEFGDTIIIERKLARGGRGSGWVIKGKKGKIKLPPGMTAAREVSSVIDHFGFMVNNPVSILTQTKAKQFLAGRKPSDHYKLYRQATLLAPLEQELDGTIDVMKAVRRKLETSETALPKAKRELEKLETAYLDAQELKNIDVRIAETRLLWAWSLVQEAEREILHMKEVTASSFEPAKESAFQGMNNLRKKIDSVSEQERQESQQLQDATGKSERVLEEYRRAQKETKKLALSLDLQNKRIINYEADFQAGERSISKARLRMEDARKKHFAGQEQKSRILQEINDLKTNEEEFSREIDVAKQHAAVVSEQKMTLENKLDAVTAQSERVRNHHEDKLRELRQAEHMARSRNSLMRFGAHAPILERIIAQNERLFQRRPVGPIGQFLSLDDESWAPAVELALGARTISTFIVHSSKDAKTLKRLFDNERRQMRGDQAGRMRMPAILVSNLDLNRYEIGQTDVPDIYDEGHLTILDAISIRNDAVFNALVDQSMIERSVLDDKNEEVTKLGWSRKPNLYMVWNKRGERAYSRNGSNTFRKAPRYNLTARYLTKDVTKYLESLREEVDRLLREQKGYDAQVASLKRDAQELHAQVQGHRRQIQRAQQKGFEAQRARMKLEDQLSQAENAFDSTPFEEEIASLKENMKQHEMGLETAKAEVKCIEEKQHMFSSEMDNAKENHLAARAETERLSKALAELHGDMSRLRSRHRQRSKEHEEAAAKLRKAHEEIAHKNASYLEGMEHARGFGACPEGIDINVLPAEKVNRRLSLLKKKLEAEQERRGGLTAEQIEEEFLKATQKYQETEQLQERIRYYERSLMRGIKNRTVKLRELSKTLKVLVRNNFRQFLSAKGHSGNVKFGRSSSGEMELHLSTKMKNHVLENGERHETKELQSLSGGEKSLTTLAFMLSMAEICQNPLRVFDEIDVYQDDATRRTSYRMVIQFCSQILSNRQIILITPCNLPEIDESPSVKVVKMPDPRPDNSGMRQTRIHEYTASRNE